MNKKLTLNIDSDLIQFAHQYSKETDQSISAIIEKYLNQLKEVKKETKLSKTANELYGIFSKKPLPDKKIMRAEFHEKSID